MTTFALKLSSECGEFECEASVELPQMKAARDAVLDPLRVKIMLKEK